MKEKKRDSYDVYKKTRRKSILYLIIKYQNKFPYLKFKRLINNKKKTKKRYINTINNIFNLII